MVAVYTFAFIAYSFIYFNWKHDLMGKYSQRFDQERWLEMEYDRNYMLDDLLEKYQLKGMKKDKIIDMLGQPVKDSPFGQSDNEIVYRLGRNRSFLGIDNDWLVIELQDDVVIHCYRCSD